MFNAEKRSGNLFHALSVQDISNLATSGATLPLAQNGVSMKKKKLVATVGTILASSIAFTAAFTGCSLVSANADADMRQVIAKVNIADAEGLSESDKALINNYKGAVGTTEIYKDELIAYFLNYGSTYYSYYQSYNTVFTMLVDSLVENAVITQYATMYLLDNKAKSSNSTTVLNEYNAKSTYVEKLEYLLTDKNAEDPEKDIKIAKYSFYTTINATLDSYENKYIDEDDETTGSGTRATPTGVDTEQDDFYPANEDGTLNYNVYTGYAGYELTASGDYQKDAHEGTTKSTRALAYNDFLGTLIENGLVDPETDDLLNVDGMEYMQREYATRLENRVINKYYDLYEAEQEAKLTDDGNYEYLNKVYQKLVGMQKDAEDSFSSTFSNMSDTSFVLYAPDTEGEGAYGFVYNILLPFSGVQNARLTALKSQYADEDTGNYTVKYYQERNAMLKEIQTTDQREAWFNGTTDYAFNAKKAGVEYYGSSDYLFFENNLTNNDRYKQLDKYIGQYAYNGRVYELEDGGYQLLPNKLNINDMLAEFKSYVNHVLGDESTTYEINENYYDQLTAETFYTEDTRGEDVKAKDREIDYNNYIYATGAVDLGDTSAAAFRSNLLNKDSKQYKALAAVNELQYAYTTDTGVLSQYIGYNVTLGDTTGYIKEFETAAHEAIARGAGAFNVCAGDYGWHLLYVTYTFSPEGGEVYTPDWNNIKAEGTFEYMFYEWLKSNDIAEISTTRRTQIMTQFNLDSTVEKIQSAYQDLLDLDS